MSRLSEMETLVQQLTGEGDLSARGQFTLDPERSRRKIVQYLATDWSAWAGWLVRAGAALGAGDGEFQLGRDTVVARLNFADSANLQFISDFLSSGRDSEEHPGLALLRTSLLWLQALLEHAPSLSANIVLQGPSGGFWVLGVDDVKTRLTPFASKHVSLSVVVQGSGLPRMYQDLSAHLPPRLQAAPVPWKLDGRALNPTLPAGELLYARLYLGSGGRGLLAAPAPATLPARNYHLGSGLGLFQRPRFSAPASVVPTLSVAGKLARTVRWSTTQGHPLLSWQQNGEVHSLFLDGLEVQPAGESWGTWLVPVFLFRRAAGPDVFRILDRGLLLDEQRLQLGGNHNLGWTAWVACDGIQTDLSGTRPVQSSQLQQLDEWLRGAIAQIHAEKHSA